MLQVGSVQPSDKIPRNLLLDMLHYATPVRAICVLMHTMVRISLNCVSNVPEVVAATKGMD